MDLDEKTPAVLGLLESISQYNLMQILAKIWI